MKIQVNVKPGRKFDKVEIEEGVYFVSLKERAEKGKANKSLIKVLAKHFNVPASNIKILHGLLSHRKIVEIK